MHKNSQSKTYKKAFYIDGEVYTALEARAKNLSYDQFICAEKTCTEKRCEAQLILTKRYNKPYFRTKKGFLDKHTCGREVISVTKENITYVKRNSSKGYTKHVINIKFDDFNKPNIDIIEENINGFTPYSQTISMELHQTNINYEDAFDMKFLVEKYRKNMNLEFRYRNKKCKFDELFENIFDRYLYILDSINASSNHQMKNLFFYGNFTIKKLHDGVVLFFIDPTHKHYNKTCCFPVKFLVSREKVNFNDHDWKLFINDVECVLSRSIQSARLYVFGSLGFMNRRGKKFIAIQVRSSMHFYLEI